MKSTNVPLAQSGCSPVTASAAKATEGVVASELTIFDLETRRPETVLRSERLIEAPNWTSDGKALIVNGDGLLYRVDLDRPARLARIDTGFAVNLNNDHGVSPDGRHLAISDSTENGQSCIYILAASGGAPRKVTQNTPSYWHGWSPDGATLVYCAARNGIYDIYSCDLQGGAETRLTDGSGHSDGPDYTPDGRWIWFNSDRSGTMQLWRMRPDGSALQRMTDDDRASWFPHPSLDGRHVLYLAYESGVEGHPRDHDVELRLMPAGGGQPETLLAILGGQGSINVPCWEPGSRRFAFMRYDR
jgi:Tol biopolymer transport system component